MSVLLNNVIYWINNLNYLNNLLRWQMVATFSETHPFTPRDHIEKRVRAFHNDEKNLLYSCYCGCFFSIFASKMLISDGL